MFRRTRRPDPFHLMRLPLPPGRHPRGQGGLQTGTAILTTTQAGDSLSSRALGDFRSEAVETGRQELQVGHGEKAENCFDRIKLIKDNCWPFLLLGPIACRSTSSSSMHVPV